MKPSSNVKRFVKVCDWLAMAFFIRREQRFGNKNLTLEDTTVFNGVRNSVRDVVDMFKCSDEWKGVSLNLSIFDTIMKMVYEK